MTHTKIVKAKIVFWTACYLSGYVSAWAFDKPPIQPPVTAQNTNYTFKINAVPTLNEIKNLNGEVLGKKNSILSPTPTPTPLAYQKTINDLSMALVTNDYQIFNSFLSSELTSTFGEDAIKQSFEDAQTTYGGIVAITPISPVQQTGNWATQEVETKTQNGLISKFRIILHLENGDWKLFGTQEIP